MNYVRTKEDLQKQLDDQIYFLKESITAFDSGREMEFKRIALTLRVLLHDSWKSKSLLGQLEMKDTLFIDSAIPFEELSQSSHSGLVMLGTPLHGGSSKPLPILDGPFESKITFDNWWNGVVFRDDGGNEFSRKDLVMTVADKDGGAHVDANLPKDYFDLREKNSLGWYDVDGQGVTSPGLDQVPAAIRQIAHEALKSLDVEYSYSVPQGDHGVFIMGASLVEGGLAPIHSFNLRKDRPNVDGKKIGRNDSCFCGSGKKYKKCCAP